MEEDHWPGPSRARVASGRQPSRPAVSRQAAEDRRRLTRPVRPADPAAGTTATGWCQAATPVRGARLTWLSAACAHRPREPRSPCAPNGAFGCATSTPRWRHRAGCPARPGEATPSPRSHPAPRASMLRVVTVPDGAEGGAPCCALWPGRRAHGRWGAERGAIWCGAGSRGLVPGGCPRDLAVGVDMRAVGVTEWGGPDVLQVLDLPTPEAGPGQVRIRVYAAAVNPTTHCCGTVAGPRRCGTCRRRSCRGWTRPGCWTRSDPASRPACRSATR